MDDKPNGPPDRWRKMLEAAQEPVSVALPTACAVYNMAPNEAVVVVADRRSSFGSSLVQSYIDRGAPPDTGADEPDGIPLAVSAMSLAAWRDMLGSAAPELVAHVEKKPADMAALVLIDEHNRCEVFFVPTDLLEVTAPGGEA
jgi:hypothetical protein